MILPIIGSSLVGGLIGYGTNWLAIKMLFWPLHEKRLFGRAVPFTPGLIPKKRDRLAAALGETVAEHLVTKATLSAALSTSEFELQLNAWLQSAREQLLDDNLSFRRLFGALGLSDDLLAAQLASLLGTWLRENSSPELVKPLVREIIQTMAKPVPHSSGTSFWVTLSQSEALRGTLAHSLSGWLLAGLQQERSLGEALPPEFRSSIKHTLLRQLPVWLDQAKLALESDASQVLVKRLIKQLLGSNPLLKLLAAFADNDRIARALPELLEREELRVELAEQILQLFDRLWEQPIDQLVAALITETPEAASTEAFLAALITEERVAGWLQVLEQQLSAVDLAGIIIELEPKLSTLGAEHVGRYLRQLGENQSGCELLAAKLLKLGLDMPIGRPVDILLMQTSAGARLPALLRALIDTHGQTVLDSLRLPQVVEAQVNALDVREVEEILLKVMHEQLGAITNLGFLLGAIIGLILPALNGWLASL